MINETLEAAIQINDRLVILRKQLIDMERLSASDCLPATKFEDLLIKRDLSFSKKLGEDDYYNATLKMVVDEIALLEDKLVRL